jgi:hypothetical protein
VPRSRVSQAGQLVMRRVLVAVATYIKQISIIYLNSCGIVGINILDARHEDTPSMMQKLAQDLETNGFVSTNLFFFWSGSGQILARCVHSWRSDTFFSNFMHRLPSSSLIGRFRSPCLKLPYVRSAIILAILGYDSK